MTCRPSCMSCLLYPHACFHESSNKKDEKIFINSQLWQSKSGILTSNLTPVGIYVSSKQLFLLLFVDSETRRDTRAALLCLQSLLWPLNSSVQSRHLHIYIVFPSADVDFSSGRPLPLVNSGSNMSGVNTRPVLHLNITQTLFWNRAQSWQTYMDKEPAFFSTEAIFISEGLGFADVIMHLQLIDQNALQNTTPYHSPSLFFPSPLINFNHVIRKTQLC